MYYPMEVDHVVNKRIRLLLNDCGPDGYWIWACIVAQAYKIYGYYYPVTGDDIDLFSADVCRKPPEFVWSVVGSCVKRGLFDTHVFEKYSVLTNDRMQLNFIRGTFDRRRKGASVYFFEKHLIISQTELAGIGDKYIDKIILKETGENLQSYISAHTGNNLFSGGKESISAEKQIIPTEKQDFPRKERERERERDYISTNVETAIAAPESNVISLKSVVDKHISDLASKNGKPKKEKKARAAKKNPDSEPYWHVLRRGWVDFNLKHLKFKVEPMPKADYSFMHRIVEKIRERATDQGVPWTEQEAVVRWEKFLITAYNCEKWLHDHFELKNLNTQMQSIFNLVDNGHTGSKNNGTIGKTNFHSGPNIDTNATSSGKW